MSGFVPGKNTAFGKIHKKVDPTYDVWRKSLSPDMPKIPETPAAPTIDTAQQNRDQQDRLRRRRGVLANIYAGGSNTGGSAAGTKALLGG